MFQDLISALATLEGVLWATPVLFVILGVGVLFTIWSGVGQYRAITHGIQVVRGKYDDKDDPGAISHFQALSAALSATVGLGNIGGVALAIALGGPGAVFWMWVVGFFGMAIKMTEVSMSMLYRNTEDSDNPHGGPMWVAEKGFAELFPNVARLGVFIGGLYVVTLLISTVTGGNMYQAWNVADITNNYFGIDKIVTGIILAVIVGLVIIGGIKRIGSVAGRIVPLMCAMYFLAAVVVIAMNITEIPALLSLIVTNAFAPGESVGAFVGGTAGYAFLWGMKRALFSNEAGQGSAPIAHSAAKTQEPIREGVVAGLEPLIDTIIVCTLTALVILSSGIWNRDTGEAAFPIGTQLVETEEGSGEWAPVITDAPDVLKGDDWINGEQIFIVVETQGVTDDEGNEDVSNANAGSNRHRIGGVVSKVMEDGQVVADAPIQIEWSPLEYVGEAPQILQLGQEDGLPVFRDYQGATLTARAFDRGTNSNLGKWLVSIAAWLFAISTMISWSYYGEQGIVYLFGDGAVFLYKIIFCLLIIIACTPLLPNDAAVGTLTGFGTGVMLFANIPIMLIFGAYTMKKYHGYIGKLKRGEFHPHAAKSVVDMVEDND
jgi:AGCS family alanine or glycine:cation symporter